MPSRALLSDNRRMELGYPIAQEAFDLEIYNLACVFAASKRLAEWARDSGALDALRERFEQSEASRRLVAVAIIARSKLDSRTVVRNMQLEQIISSNVGALARDMTQAEQKAELKFRDACNKIIHANSIDLMDDANPQTAELCDIAVLTGEMHQPGIGQCEWKAEVNIPKFIRVASLL
mgnify:CR=1 FL=1